MRNYPDMLIGGGEMYVHVFTGWKRGVACETRTQYPVSSSTIFQLIFEIETLVEPGAFPLTWLARKPPRIHLFLPTLLSAGLIDTCLSARLLHGCLGSELWSSYLWHRCFNQWLLNIEEMDPASLRKSHRDWIHFSHLPSPMQRLITWCSLLPFPSLKS